ncbi:hypothetical protein Leryth_019374 [Lithospermum erythrorhizon]|nr:hypothetical protein Leryth_019374 [Lithospermum erythrorhizon]
MVNPRCFMDISIGGEVEGRIVMELYTHIVPKTVENFRALCTGEKGISPTTGTPLHYKGCCFHRVVRGYMVQSGDISGGNGTCGESIYGLKFEDENFEMKHERKGMLSMANVGPDTNGSQFLIAITSLPHLNGKNVVFGKVIKGLGLVRSIELVSVDDDGCPIIDVLIANCGEILEGEDDRIINFFKDGDKYPDWPADLEVRPNEPSGWISAVSYIKALGNDYFKKLDYRMALKKYCKSLRYLDQCWNSEDIDPAIQATLKNLKCQIFSNTSVCRLKTGDLAGALLQAEFAIRDGRDNPKAFFRQGQAYMALKIFEAAVESYQKALEEKGIFKDVSATSINVEANLRGQQEA